jgi:hypothetical protein
MVVEAAIIGLLLYRRVWRTLPIFCAYVLWTLVSDAGNFLIKRHLNDPASHAYLVAFIVSTVVDSTLQISVLIEIAWSVLRPLRSSLSRKTLLVVALLVLAIGAAVWPFSGMHELASLPPAWRNFAACASRPPQSCSILFFLALAGEQPDCSLSGGETANCRLPPVWAFYSLVSLAVSPFGVRTRGVRSLNTSSPIGSSDCQLLLLPALLGLQLRSKGSRAPRIHTANAELSCLLWQEHARTTRITLSQIPPSSRDRASPRVTNQRLLLPKSGFAGDCF